MEMKLRLKQLQSAYTLNHKKIVVAVSGGSDSMALAAILKALAGAVVIAHCNFGLRGAESDGDEQLVTDWAKANDIECHVKHFDTPALLQSEGGNLQELARELRYRWFEELRAALGFDWIATAHHKQDSVETMLLNFFKGTGIAGMHGILPLQGKLIRPLLSFTKAELRAYALDHQVPWREDSSNQKEDYTRNAIRHQVFPVLEKIFPNVLQQLAGNTRRFAEVEQLYKESVAAYKAKLMEQRGQEWYIPVLKLKKMPAQQTLLWEMLQPFGFTAAQVPDIHALAAAVSGKFVASRTHRIIRNRDFLIVTASKQEESGFLLLENADQHAVFDGRVLTFREKPLEEGSVEALKGLSLNEICVDAALLHFPLIVRPWRQGDYLYPLGTAAKKKKVSKLLIEQKMPVHEKEKVWVLECEKKVVWVIGLRADDRFKVKKHSVRGMYISVKPV